MSHDQRAAAPEVPVAADPSARPGDRARRRAPAGDRRVAGAGADPADAGPTTHAPSRTALTSASVVCPSAMPGSPDASPRPPTRGVPATCRGRSGRTSRRCTVRSGARLDRRPRATARSWSRGADALAPGLLGLPLRHRAARRGGLHRAVGRRSGSPGSARGADHDSVIELVNPDAGPAVADVTSTAPRRHRRTAAARHPGPRPQDGRARPRAGRPAPRRARAAGASSRAAGSAVVGARLRRPTSGPRAAAPEWLPAQPAPRPPTTCSGCPPGTGDAHAPLANPGDNVVRAEIKVDHPDTGFAPEGLDAGLGAARRRSGRLDLPSAGPGARRRRRRASRWTDDPVTATLRSVVDGDLSHATRYAGHHRDDRGLPEAASSCCWPGGPGGAARRGAGPPRQAAVTKREAARRRGGCSCRRRPRSCRSSARLGRGRGAGDGPGGTPSAARRAGAERADPVRDPSCRDGHARCRGRSVLAPRCRLAAPPWWRRARREARGPSVAARSSPQLCGSSGSPLLRGVGPRFTLPPGPASPHPGPARPRRSAPASLGRSVVVGRSAGRRPRRRCPAARRPARPPR